MATLQTLDGKTLSWAHLNAMVEDYYSRQEQVARSEEVRYRRRYNGAGNFTGLERVPVMAGRPPAPSSDVDGGGCL